MESNLKQEAMKRVGEVEHHECYYDTDRNKPLPGRRAATSVDRNSVLLHNMENVASQCRATASHPWSGQIEVDGGSGLLRELLTDAAGVLELAAERIAPQPVDAAQAVPEGLVKAASDLLACVNTLEIDTDATTTEALTAFDRTRSRLSKALAAVPVKPTDTTKGA